VSIEDKKMKTKPQLIPAFLKAYSDSSFTNPHEVVLPDDPTDQMGHFTHMGAKYWGFETDRHRSTVVNEAGQSFTYDPEAHHWFTIGLKQRALVHVLTVSTRWFTGNQVPEISVELIDRTTSTSTEVLTKVELSPDSEQIFKIPPIMATDCHIRCYHEGGISRVNLLGTELNPLYDQPNLLRDATISHTSNDHYGKPEDAVMGNREVDHMVGWESARTGFGESTIFSLPGTVMIENIIVDTYLHRLNSPLSCHIFAANLEADKLQDAQTSLPRWKLLCSDGDEIIPENFKQYMLNKEYPEKKFQIMLHQNEDTCWLPLLSFAKLSPDTWHEFDQLESSNAVNTIFYMHYPNGGIHGLKMFGKYIT
jgi:allantoicase